MPTIPQAIDYGARPSLRSNRLDPPDQSGVIIANALADAANTFGAVMAERKQKQNQIAYADVKSQLLSEDIRLRRELQDDPHYDTFEERYNEGMKAFRETLYLDSKHDRAIFDADANLTVARGVSAVAEMGRVKRIDHEVAALVRNLDQAKDDLLAADPATRNDILLTALDSIQAAEDAEQRTAVQAEAMRQSFVKDVAEAELIMMDPLDREEALKTSIAKNPSSDKIKAGKGSGSLADFLHQDEKILMLRKAQLENKTNRDRSAAFAVSDKAFELFPLETQRAERAKYVREHTEGDVRAVATSALNARNAQQTYASVTVRQGVQRSAGELMLEAYRDPEKSYTFDDIPASELKHLSPGEVATLKKFDEMLRNNEQFASVTNWIEEERDVNGELIKPAYSTWGDMSDAEKAETDLESPMWYTNLALPQWKQLKDEQDRIRSGSSVTQDQGPTDDQLLQSMVVGMDLLPKTTLDRDEHVAYQQLRFDFRDAVKIESDRKYSGGKVPYQRRRDILLEIIGQKAWERDAGFWSFFGQDASEPTPLFMMSAEQKKSGFIPIEQVRAATTEETINGVKVPMTWEQRLKNLALSELDGREAEQKDIENAYFAMISGMSNEEVLRRLAGKGDE